MDPFTKSQRKSTLSGSSWILTPDPTSARRSNSVKCLLCLFCQVNSVQDENTFFFFIPYFLPNHIKVSWFELSMNNEPSSFTLVLRNVAILDKVVNNYKNKWNVCLLGGCFLFTKYKRRDILTNIKKRDWNNIKIYLII